MYLPFRLFLDFLRFLLFEYVFQKLGKSIVAYSDIQKDEELSLDNLSGVIFNEHHIPVRDSGKVIGMKSNKLIKKGDPIDYKDLY